MDTGERIDDFVDYQVNAMMLGTIGAGMVVFSFVINDVVHSINNGGIFSFVSGVQSMQARAARVDIDFASLRIVFVVLCYLITTGIGILFRIVLNKKNRIFFRIFWTRGRCASRQLGRGEAHCHSRVAPRLYPLYNPRSHDWGRQGQSVAQ